MCRSGISACPLPTCASHWIESVRRRASPPSPDELPSLLAVILRELPLSFRIRRALLPPSRRQRPPLPYQESAVDAGQLSSVFSGWPCRPLFGGCHRHLRTAHQESLATG